MAVVDVVVNVVVVVDESRGNCTTTRPKIVKVHDHVHDHVHDEVGLR